MLKKNIIHTSSVLWVFIMNEIGQIATIVQDHIQRLAVLEHQRLLDTPEVLLLGLALPRVHRDTSLSDGSGGVVLSREDVAARPLNLSAELDERLDEHRRLDGHVQTAGNASAL